ncbi:MAG TPA: hypothetical protein VE622_02380 [Nitrososphaeraceae archaeon]|nr:hypothetical protein [Nitrososphaeraceae archaeon]
MSITDFNLQINWRGMASFEDSNGHIVESKVQYHRLIYCPSCDKWMSKADCQRLQKDKNGKLYPVKRYSYPFYRRDYYLKNKYRFNYRKIQVKRYM